MAFRDARVPLVGETGADGVEVADEVLSEVAEAGQFGGGAGRFDPAVGYSFALYVGVVWAKERTCHRSLAGAPGWESMRPALLCGHGQSRAPTGLDSRPQGKSPSRGPSTAVEPL